MSREPPVGWIREVVLDAPDPWALARFWSGLLGGTPVEWYPGWVTLEPPPHGQRLSFQGTGTPLAEDTARVHFDILVEDLAAAHDRVLSAGATLASEHVSPRPGPGGQSVPWRVYRDPAGHPFCLVVRLRSEARPKGTTCPMQSLRWRGLRIRAHGRHHAAHGMPSGTRPDRDHRAGRPSSR